MRIAASRGTLMDAPGGVHDNTRSGAHSPGNGWTSEGRLQPPAESATRAKLPSAKLVRMLARAANAARRPLALAVQADLLANDVVAEPGAQVVLEAIGKRDNHVLDAAVRNELGEQ